MTNRRPLWLAIALTLAVLGCCASVLGAHAVAKNDAAASRHLFQASSSDIATTLRLDIQHEQDLVLSTGAYFVSFPGATQGDFQRWMSSLDAFQRYPELSGVAEVVIVPRSQLSAYEASAIAHPAGPLGPGKTFQVIPSGSRPYYCFARVEVARGGHSTEPAGLDFCDTPLGPLFLKARDDGEGAYVPYGSGASELFVVGMPVYSTGVAPSTVAQRRADFLGWTGTELRPHVLLATAMAGHANMAVTFRYRTSAMMASFEDGRLPRGATSEVVSFHNGWSVETFASVSGTSLTANANALALLLSGAALSVLLGLLIFVLGTGRSRALGLVSERTNELQHLALHDVLTGLPNRALILDRVEQMIARARRDNTEVALLFLDLDNFKDINDTLGHSMGDQLLIEVGNRLTRTLRGGDTVGRLGGDEFVVLAEGPSLAPGAEALAERILDVMRSPFELPGSDVPLVISASIGIAEGVRSAGEELLRDADIAMYRAKSVGKQRAVMFLPSMQEAIVDKRMLAIDLHSALENDEFFLLYQPIVELDSGIVTGVEALLRWRHPERGVIQPDQFIPALESSGLIVPTGLWVLQEACRQGATWLAAGTRLTMSINVSAKQLERDRIVDDVLRTLDETGFDPSLLILELTETTLMLDVEVTVERLKLLKALGVRIAIDDFGTGYSSLAYLRQFPIDIIKIDRTFVSGVVDTAEAATLVHTLVQLGKALGLGIIAEGVETDAQRRKLISEDTDSAQGFLFARPLTIEDLGTLLANESNRPGIHSTAD
jgi:diguanylate cyclase (GGDEF)-like protein